MQLQILDDTEVMMQHRMADFLLWLWFGPTVTDTLCDWLSGCFCQAMGLAGSSYFSSMLDAIYVS